MWYNCYCYYYYYFVGSKSTQPANFAGWLQLWSPLKKQQQQKWCPLYVCVRLFGFATRWPLFTTSLLYFSYSLLSVANYHYSLVWTSDTSNSCCCYCYCYCIAAFYSCCMCMCVCVCRYFFFYNIYIIICWVHQNTWSDTDQVHMDTPNIWWINISLRSLPTVARFVLLL